MADLPAERLTLGLQIHAADANIVLKDSGPLDCTVSLKMLNEAGDVIVEERGPLRIWGWTYRLDRPHEAFVYRAGFTPRRRGRYSVTLEIEPGSARAVPVQARLQMRGGGWK